jgi:cytosine deaminase
VGVVPEGDAPSEDLGGRLVVPGLVETHVHLDKSCLLDRCTCHRGTLEEAIASVTAAKRGFTEEDVYARASRTLEKAITQGTQHIRTHVEVDPRIGLTSLRALLQLKQDYAWAVDLQICVFPQEGLLDDPGCEEVLVAALEAGADVVGGAPYMDRDRHGQIARIFALAERFGVDVDFHLDFSLDPTHLDLLEVCRLTEETGWGGRVAIGHVTKLSAVPAARLAELGARLARAGVAVTSLPATDLFLTARDHDHTVPRGVAPVHRLVEMGVTCSLSTNNVLNPFTPFGDCSLVRMSNLYANVAQVGTPAGMAVCLDMVSGMSARLLNLPDYGIREGARADLVVLDCESSAGAVAEIAQPLFGLKGGRRTFTRPAARIHRPGEDA